MNEKQIKAVIIDDESKSRNTLREMLGRYCVNVNVIAEADGVETALQMMKNLNPDIVFLDIRMNDGTGFDFLKKLPEKDFNLVFTTAYDQYAIQAIRYSALDYLLKPIDAEELKMAVEKARLNTTSSSEQLDILLENTFNADNLRKIVFSTSEGMHVIEVDNIIRCEADDYYTRIHIKGRPQIMVSKTLKEVEDMLKGNSFVRNHKSHLVNMSYIDTYVKSGGGYLVMSTGEKIPVSRRKKELMFKALSKLNR